MATRRTSHSRKSRTRRSRRAHRKHRTHRSRRGGAGSSLNPMAKPYSSKLRGNAPAFVPAGPSHGNIAAAEYASRTQGATIMRPYNRNANIAAAEYNSRTQGARIMEPYGGVTRPY
jgi:hypothetical protein